MNSSGRNYRHNDGTNVGSHTFTNCQYLFRSKILPDKEELEGTSVYEIDNKKWDLPELRPLE
jgi:hypothetical protein